MPEFKHQRRARSAIARVLLQAMDRGDVLVIERGEHLERDVAVQARIMRPIDLAHPTSPDHAGDFVRTDTVTGDQRH